MYNPKINNEQLKKLYLLKEFIRKKGVKCSIAGLVRDALDDYFKKVNLGLKNRGGIILPNQYKNGS